MGKLEQAFMALYGALHDDVCAQIRAGIRADFASVERRVDVKGGHLMLTLSMSVHPDEAAPAPALLLEPA